MTRILSTTATRLLIIFCSLVNGGGGYGIRAGEILIGDDVDPPKHFLVFANWTAVGFPICDLG